ncbi:putative uncharacterized protein [Ruminococcus sp. CAG:9]|nr:putative uncharacterized protein [Ruminococcus sp. CAG:9]
MVVYFSGTGNSKYIAERIAGSLQEKLLCMNERIGSRGHKVEEIRQEFFGGTKPCYKKNCILRGGFYKC